MSQRKTRRLLCCAALTTLTFGSHVLAQVTAWTQSAGGTFNVAGNWNNGVPGANATAVFSINSAYNVTFTSSPIFRQLSLTGGTPTFVNNGVTRTVNVSGAAFLAGGALFLDGVNLNTSMGLFVRNTSNLTLLNSTLVTPTATIGELSTGGSVFVSGSNSSFTSNGSDDNFLAANNNSITAAFTLQLGATASFGGTLRLADTANSNLSASFLVSSNSSLAINGLKLATIGTNNNATLTINNAAVTQTGAASTTIGGSGASHGTLVLLSNAVFSSSTGTFLVNSNGTVAINSGTLNLNSATVIINGTLNRTGGSINLAPGQQFTIQDGGVGSFTSAFAAPAGGTFTVTGTNSRASTNSSFSVNDGATARVAQGAVLTAQTVNIGTGGALPSTLTVDNAGMAVSAGLNVGMNGSAGQFSLINGAGTTVNGPFQVAQDANSTGTVQVNGSQLSLIGLFLANTGAANAQARFDVVGNSTINIAGSSSIIGTGNANSGSSATLTLSNGQLDIGSNSNFNVLNTGHVQVLSGTFNNMGNVQLVSGDLSVAPAGRFISAANSNLLISSSGVATFGSSVFVDGSIHVLSGLLDANATLICHPTGRITVSSSGTLDAANGAITPDGGTITLDGGRIIVGTLTPSSTPGTFHFNGGTLSYVGNANLDFATTDLLLTPTHALLPGRNLFAGGTANLSTFLTVDGGHLSVGSLGGSGELILKSGTFSISNGTLNVSAGGRLGNTINIVPELTLNTVGLQIFNGGRVFVGGALNASSLTINAGGELNLTGQLASVSATSFLNNGLTHGNGMLRSALTNQSGGILRASAGERMVLSGGLFNSGTVTLLGGQIELSHTNPAFNQNHGYITGRGSLLMSGLTNNGTVALSAGISDVTGAISNAGTIIVTGGATATFYDNVDNLPGSQVRVSPGSTAVFIGDVSGLGAFTGTGVKIFEGSASSGPLATPGSSVVGSDSTLSASTIRESALTIIGTAIINPDGTSSATSRLTTLTIDGQPDAWSGRLDLTNNALVIDYAGASPIETIASQILSGYADGQWTGDGITSSLAAMIAAHPSDPHKTAIGFAEASNLALSSFVGQSFTGDAVLLRYVYVGDANLDGVVNVLDFNRLATNFGQDQSASWIDADFNYDGTVNTLDFNALAVNFNQMLAPTPAAGVLVPEPGSAVALALLGLCARRRKCPNHRTAPPAPSSDHT